MKNILFHINEGAHLVTVNRRLARLIINGFDRHMLEMGKEGWATPVVTSLGGWFQKAWDNIWENKKPYISTIRGKVLWEKVISEDITLHNIPFLNLSDMSEEAWKAYEIFRTYRLPMQEENIYGTRETLAFNRWLRGYRRALDDLGFIDVYDMRERVIGGIRSGLIEIPDEMRLVGFQEISPEIGDLIEAIRGRGVRIDFFPSNPFSEDWKRFRAEELADRISVRRYKDISDEASQCARWIRSVYSPDTTIGIVVPDLNKYRDVIAKEFSAELDPVSAISWRRPQEGYNISLGIRLPEIPIIRYALEILSIGAGEIDLNTIEYLIGSPYLYGAAAEFLDRGRLIYQLRDANYSKISISKLSFLLTKKKLSLPVLSSVLDNLKGAFKEYCKKRCLPSSWSNLFSVLLNDVGWGIGDDSFSLGSDEYQAAAAWNDLFSDFATLDEILGEISYRDACRRLFSLAGGRLYQQGGHDSPIQVLGLLESSAINFDYLWIMGAVEGVVPAKANPNPFLSLNIQKECNTPHSSPEREVEFAKKNIFDLLQRGKNIVISYPRLDEAVESRISPIFAGLSTDDEIPYIEKGNRFIDLVRAEENNLEDLPDEPLPVSAEEIPYIRGGTYIAKDQAACPFKSLIAHRVGAKEWPKVDIGFGPLEKGTLIHSSLEAFWSKVKKKETLELLYETGEIKDRVAESVETAFKGLKKYAFSKEYVVLEKKRITSLLFEWLEVERQRPPFEVVEFEKKRELSIKGLNVHTKADRIDRTPDGSEILIDYKSGECSISNWDIPRPKEPQMMIYGMDGDYSAIAFAKIKRGESRFIGIAKEGYAEDINGQKSKEMPRDEWKEIMDSWKKEVERLFADFMAGEARVEPLGGVSSDACKFCPYSSLCRKAELLV